MPDPAPHPITIGWTFHGARERAARRWSAIVLSAWKEFNNDQIPTVAAGVTFYALLALFPGMGAFVSLYGLVANVGDAERQVAALHGLLPGGATSVIGDQLARVIRTDHASLGLTFAAGLAFPLWSANAGMKALIAGLDVAYEVKERRGFFNLNAISLTFTLGTILLAMAAVSAVVAAPPLLRRFGIDGAAAVLRWPAMLIVVTALISLLFRFGPCRPLTHWRWITPGSAVAAFGWMLMSVMFSWYVGNFGHYDRTYGSLGAMIGFMTWIWLSLMVVLLGAELNCEMEHYTSRGAIRRAGR
jgi:membrane protein